MLNSQTWLQFVSSLITYILQCYLTQNKIKKNSIFVKLYEQKFTKEK